MNPGDIDIPMAKARALAAKAATVFKPRTPLIGKDLFAGRWNELLEISDAIHQPGLHVVIYGERGVGKSSLANVVSPTIWAIDRSGKREDEFDDVPERLVIKSVANSGDTFSTLWHRLFAQLQWPNPDGSGTVVSTRVAFSLLDTLGIDDVRRVLSDTSGGVFIIDEFDQSGRPASKSGVIGGRLVGPEPSHA